MAEIDNIEVEASTKNTNVYVSKTDMQINVSANGKYIILSTFGSKSRQNPGKVSQTIHLTKEKAAELAEILQRWSK